MTSLMLRASSEVIKQAQNELLVHGYTSMQISQELNLAVQLVENFLTGEIVDRHSYDLICQKLNIDETSSQEVIKVSVNSPTDSAIPDLEDDLDTLMHSMALNGVSESEMDLANTANLHTPLSVRGDDKGGTAMSNRVLDLRMLRTQFAKMINHQCDRLKVLDLNKPLKLSDLYTEIKLFQTIASYQYLDLEEVFPNVSPENLDHFYLQKLHPDTLDISQAIANHPQILIVGGLGSGKTTLLKYLALSLINSDTSSNIDNKENSELKVQEFLPVYIPLRSLINSYSSAKISSILQQQLDNYGWSKLNLGEAATEQILSTGKFWLLWDEIDDLPESQRSEIALQIAQFSDRYPQNPMAIATRNPSLSYILPSFTSLEIAPFQNIQINTFVSKWFKITNPDNPKKIEKFQQLLSSNQPLAEIATTPLFLTYLCNYFNSFTSVKTNFYQDIINLCLTKWQDYKCLPLLGDSSQSKLSTRQKLDLLSYIAIVALDRHGYVWQNQQLEKDIEDCLASSHALKSIDPSLNYDTLYQWMRSQHGLLIEPAKGIYSLRHTTLHDYLAAYRIANIHSNIAEKYLLDRIYLKQWYGVVVMTASISQNADQMLQTMKRKIDELVINDSHLQSFLTWVNQQSLQMQTPYKAVTIRALYLDIDLENTRSLDRARALDIAHSRSLERARMKAMGVENTMETEVDIDYTINLALNLDLALFFHNHPIVELAASLESDLRRGLQFLRQKFPDPQKDRANFAKWWQAKGLDWSKKLRALIVHHRKGSQDWKFSDNQLKVLRTYHDANKLLVECLYSAEYVSPLVRGQIESNLLLPQNEYSILGGRN